MYETVLASVDGSDGAAETLTPAIDLARQNDATLEFLYGVEA
ncbi:universal stress protein [Halopiger goleimassiliensis]|nr:universal stress protein [Halopiger goleimassiliensis]